MIKKLSIFMVLLCSSMIYFGAYNGNQNGNNPNDRATAVVTPDGIFAVASAQQFIPVNPNGNVRAVSPDGTPVRELGGLPRPLVDPGAPMRVLVVQANRANRMEPRNLFA